MAEPMPLKTFLHIHQQPARPEPQLRRAIRSAVDWTLQHLPSPVGPLATEGAPTVLTSFRHEDGLLLVSVLLRPELREDGRAVLEQLHHKYALVGAIAHTAAAHHWVPRFLLHGSPQLVLAVLAPAPVEATHG